MCWPRSCHVQARDPACVRPTAAWPRCRLAPADPFRTCPEELADACDATGYPGSQVPAQTAPPLAPDKPQQVWHAQPGGGCPTPPAGLQRFSSAYDAPAGGPLAHAEQGGQQHGASPIEKGSDADADGSEAAALTYAQRLRREGGELRSRGHLAAALCKARQDVLLSVFVTRPAVWSPLFNFLQARALHAAAPPGAGGRCCNSTCCNSAAMAVGKLGWHRCLPAEPAASAALCAPCL